MLEQRAIEARQTFKADFLNKMAEYGMTIDDFKPKTKEKKKRETKPKYQHPTDPAQQWSGRGTPPAWLQELLDQGRELEEFAIGTSNA